MLQCLAVEPCYLASRRIPIDTTILLCASLVLQVLLCIFRLGTVFGYISIYLTSTSCLLFQVGEVSSGFSSLTPFRFRIAFLSSAVSLPLHSVVVEWPLWENSLPEWAFLWTWDKYNPITFKSKELFWKIFKFLSRVNRCADFSNFTPIFESKIRRVYCGMRRFLYKISENQKSAHFWQKSAFFKFFDKNRRKNLKFPE